MSGDKVPYSVVPVTRRGRIGRGGVNREKVPLTPSFLTSTDMCEGRGGVWGCGSVCVPVPTKVDLDGTLSTDDQPSPTTSMCHDTNNLKGHVINDRFSELCVRTLSPGP